MTGMQYLENIIDTLRGPLLVLDSGLRIVTENRAYRTLFQCDDMVGAYFFAIGGGCWRLPALQERLEQVAAGVPADEDLELSGDFHGAGWRTLLLNARALDMVSGYVVLALEDVTAQRVAEAEAARLLAELNRSNEELERFAYVASHDLQEPLRMVSSYTQIIARKYGELLDDQGQRYVAFAVDGAHRMQALINGLLDYSRIGTRGVELGPVDLNTVIGQVLSNLELALEHAGGTVNVDVLPSVIGDANQLMRVFQNLLANSLKFHGSEPARIDIGAEVRAGEAVVSVRDNGIGIEPKYFEKMFVVFQRLHTREEYPGHGLGLAIAKRIVERHGGRMWVESSPGHGSTFHMTLRTAEGLR